MVAALGLAFWLATQWLLVLVYSDSAQAFVVRQFTTGTAHTMQMRLAMIDRLQQHFAAHSPALINDMRFSYRERSHFREVATRLQMLNTAAWAGLLGLFAGVAMIMKAGGQHQTGVSQLGSVLRNCGWVLLLSAGAAAVLAAWFESGFARLHPLVFTGTNWLLPGDALTLALFPHSYFLGITLCYTAGLALLGTLLAASRYLLRGTVGTVA